MVEVVGSDVKKLKRIRVENIMLGDLAEGQWRKFTPSERK
jgi:16S rRNA U516 pseudouridylate synthase RsuA-like enzyme